MADEHKSLGLIDPKGVACYGDEITIGSLAGGLSASSRRRRQVVTSRGVLFIYNEVNHEKFFIVPFFFAGRRISGRL